MFVIHQFPVTALDESVNMRFLLRGIARLSMAGYSAASMQAMRIDDDCHLIDSVEVGLSVRNELMRQRREGW
jgi:hypothetical protein